jgi:hypothetical protein
MWNEMSSTIPAMLAALEARVTELSAMKKLPAGMTAETLESVKTDMTAAQAQWSQASTAYEEGRAADAMQLGMQVKSTVEGLMGKIGMGAAAPSS